MAEPLRAAALPAQACARGIGILLLCALAAGAQAAPPPAAPARYRILVNSALVILPVTVTGRRGQAVAGLSAANFRVYEDGRRQTITVFDAGHAPVTVGLIVDHSGSMAGKLPEVAAAIRAFARSSDPRDQMFVVDFNERASVEPMDGKIFSSNPAMLENALDAVSAGGETALYDAVAVGLRILRRGRWQRRALIVVSDGGDNASHLSFARIRTLARRSDAAIYAIGLVGGPDDQQNPGLLKRLCRATGGIAYFPRAGDSVAAISAAIAGDLRSQYTLGYVPPARTGGRAFRRVTVRVVAPGRGRLTVRTRPGYLAGLNSGPGAARLLPALPRR